MKTMVYRSLCLGLMLGMLTVPFALMSPASAQEGQFCVWQHRARGPIPPSGDSQCFDPGNHPIKTELRNRVSALRNGTRTTLCAFSELDQRGFQLSVGAGSRFADLSRDTRPDGRSWDNRVRSIGHCK
jgi:hypothetical protein